MKTEIDKKYPMVVKIIRNDDGDKVSSPKWHYIFDHGSGLQTLCTSEFFGYGESGAEYKQKQGKITCQDCIEMIKELKRVRL